MAKRYRVGGSVRFNNAVMCAMLRMGLRAAEGRAELIRGGRTEPIIATELPPERAAPILGDSLRAGPPGVPRSIVRGYRRFLVLPYLDVDTNSSLTEFERAASTHPVFLIRPGSPDHH